MRRPLVSVCFASVLLLGLPAPSPAPGYPSLMVTKQCSDPSFPGGMIPYSGMVRNTSAYYPLRDVTVVDDSGTPADPGDDVQVLYLAELVPGGTATFTGSYAPPSNPATNTVTATGWANGFEATATASATCGWAEGGCTLTPGYWKTHSKYGPAPYDATWGDLEDEVFFLSGMSAYQVMWREPSDSPYFTLAHQFIAAYLNALKGASLPAEVEAAWLEAEGLFQAYAPGQVTKKGGGALKTRFTALATLLDDYNNGATGPGHCDKK